VRILHLSFNVIQLLMVLNRCDLKLSPESQLSFWSVIPAESGIQSWFIPPRVAICLHAGFRRHDDGANNSVGVCRSGCTFIVSVYTSFFGTTKSLFVSWKDILTNLRDTVLIICARMQTGEPFGAHPLFERPAFFERL
jgi:hypothetical protein